MNTTTKEETNAQNALAGTTAVLGAVLASAFLSWASGSALSVFDPVNVALLATLVPLAVAAQFALNTDNPPTLPVKAALRFTALALGLTATLAAIVGVTAFNVFGFYVPAAAVAALIVLAASGMAGLGYATFDLGAAPQNAVTKASTAARMIHFEPSNDRQAMRDFDRRLQQALAEAQIEVEFDHEQTTGSPSHRATTSRHDIS